MLEAVFIGAILVGLVSAWFEIGAAHAARWKAWPKGWTACALLAGTFLESAFDVFGLPFNITLWMLVDTAVIVAILRPGWTWADALVIALFVPAWGFYFVDGWNGYAGSVAVCSSQFLLAFPWNKAWRRIKQLELPFDPFRDFDLRVRHA